METPAYRKTEKRRYNSTESAPEARHMIIQQHTTTSEHSPQFVGRLTASSPKLQSSPSEILTGRCASISESQSDDETCWEWELSQDALRPLPPYYILDRSSTTVDLPIPTILNRIVNYLRVKSITCSFNPKQTEIDCHTPNLLHFVINFWKGPGSSVIVELQRRMGDAIEMHRVRQTLFHTIRTGNEPTSAPLDRCAMISPKSICPLVKKMFEEQARTDEARDDEPSSQEECCREGMVVCHDLLESKCEDQNQLGMESLVFLTDAAVVGEEIAQEVAQALLFGHDPCGGPLRQEIIKYFEEPLHPRERDIRRDPLEDTYDDAMHNLALRALSNALEGIVNMPDDCQKHIDLSSYFWIKVSDSLVYNLTEATHRPQEAALSAKCINLLEQIAPDAVDLFDSRLTPYLLKAQAFGKAHHLLLERESHKLLRNLGDFAT